LVCFSISDLWNRTKYFFKYSIRFNRFFFMIRFFRLFFSVYQFNRFFSFFSSPYFYHLSRHGIYTSVLKYLYNFHFSFPFFFLLELLPKFFKSLDEDAFLKLLQVHYYELL
jgi:hypothetical protein